MSLVVVVSVSISCPSVPLLLSSTDNSGSIDLWGILVFLIIATFLSFVTRRRTRKK